MICPICDSESTHAFTKEGYAYHRCNACGFLFHRSAGAGGTHPFYDEDYWKFERAEADRREREDSFVRALELIYLSDIEVRNVLDFGCGLGITVRLLRDTLALNAVGVDLSADIEETGFLHRCELKDLVSRYPGGFFDAIYSIEVFEHLEDPKQILSLLRHLLKPGGKIMINTGTQEYLNRHDPGLTYIDPVRRSHISIFSLPSLQALAATIGYAAQFLAGRQYLTILSPPDARPAFPLEVNLDRLRRAGPWYPSLFREYMRLVALELEFQQKCEWIKELQSEIESLRSGRTRQLGGLASR